jgi:hypothetical protein
MKICAESCKELQRNNGFTNHRPPPVKHSRAKGERCSGGNDSANNVGSPRPQDPIRVRNDDIVIRIMPHDTRVAIAVVAEIGEFEARQQEKPCGIDERARGISRGGR